MGREVVKCNVSYITTKFGFNNKTILVTFMPSSESPSHIAIWYLVEKWGSKYNMSHWLKGFRFRYYNQLILIFMYGDQKMHKWQDTDHLMYDLNVGKSWCNKNENICYLFDISHLYQIRLLLLSSRNQGWVRSNLILNKIYKNGFWPSLSLTKDRFSNICNFSATICKIILPLVFSWLLVGRKNDK